MKNTLVLLCSSALFLTSCASAPTSPTVGSGSSTTATETVTFTMNEVSTHNTEKDCYVVIDNEVYDFANWVNRHPGGADSIISTCGKNISELEHPGTPLKTLKGRMARYKIGTLQE